MGQRYWVIGGEYSRLPLRARSCPAPKRFPAPSTTSCKARKEWQRLTFRDRCAATERYSICVEPVLQ